MCDKPNLFESIMKNTDKQYSDLGNFVLKNGKPSGDRTGTGTRRLMGLQMRFDLAEGFPFVTTKKVSLGYIAKEFQWMMRGSTSQKVLKEDYKCTIWDEWADEFGRLGPVYGAMFRRRPAVKIEQVRMDLDMRLGLSLTDATVSKMVSKSRRLYKPAVNNPVWSVWTRLLNQVSARSHTKLSDNTDVPAQFQQATLHPEWSDFQKFEKDFFEVPGNELACAIESMDTWQFMTTNLGNGYYGPGSLELIEDYKVKLCSYGAIETHTLHDQGEYRYVIKPRFYIDQMAEAIHQIKTNPNNRRIIVDAWEPSLLPKDGVDPTEQAKLGLMALAPCHCMFQFFVTPQGEGKKSKLSLELFQRSADVALGVPYNIAFYSMLVHVIARECNLDVGEFVWTGGDVHVYANHVNTLKTQLRRKNRTLPKLVLDESIKGLSTFDFTKVRLEGYEHGPVTNYPVAK